MSAAFNKPVRIERPAAGGDGYGAATGVWEPMAAMVWAEIQDDMPSRSTEEKAGQTQVTVGRARVRMHWRTGITPAMRLVELSGRLRTLAIVSDIAEIHGGRHLEFMVERYSV